MSTSSGIEGSCHSGALLLSSFFVPGTILGPGIVEMNKAGTVHPLSDLGFADGRCFCVNLEKRANLSEPVYLTFKPKGWSRL